MKIFLLLLILNFQFSIFNSTAQSPDWLWAKGIGGTNIDRPFSITVDASGNVYTTGTFTDTADFDPGVGVFNLTGGGTYISKLDSSGNFVWAKAISGSGSCIAIDPAGSGDVYTTGFFYGTVDFDPGAGIFNLTSVGICDIFIIKLDSSGNFVWAKTIGGIGFDYGNSIAIDPVGGGDVYITGPFEETADFDPGAGVFNLTSAGGWDISITKLDSAGNFVWAKVMGAFNSDVSYSIAIDPTGNGDVYTTGHFNGPVDFDPGAGIFNLTGGGGFISKLDYAGNFVWAKATGAVGGSIEIDTAGSGEVYTNGFFGGTADFDPGTGIFNLTSNGNEDIFISKLDSSGNFVWAKSMGGADSDYGFSITLDPAGSGDVYTTGTFWGTADFDLGAGDFNITAAGYYDSFISKLNSLGNFVWAKTAGGIYSDQGYSIALDASGNVHVTGDLNSPSISFGSTNLTNAGASDIFIAKLDSTIISGNNEIENLNKGILLFPNPISNSTIISFFLIEPQNVSLKIFDVNGRLVTSLADKMFEEGANEITWNAGDVNAGIYFVRLETTSYSENRKLFVTK